MQKVEWGEFNVIDVFDVKNTGNILSRDISENSGETPYLCASAGNNAVSSYISYDEKYLDKGNCIFIGGKTFVVTYQEKDFYSNDSHNLVLYLKNEEKRNKVYQLFLAACINKSFGHKYSWGDSISNRKIQKEKVSLPVKNGKIDFDFMESFIAELEAERIAELEAYLAATGLKDYTLTAKEQQVLEDFEHGKISFSEFKVGELFEINSYKKRFDANKVVIAEVGNPYVVRTSLNNGIRGYINEDAQYLNEGNTISFGQDTATMFYQEKSYFTGDKIKIVKSKDNRLNKLNAQFFIATLSKSFSSFSWGSSSFSVKIIENQLMKLPSIKYQPDYAIMETFISAIQKLVIKDVVVYADKKISATKQVTACDII